MRAGCHAVDAVFLHEPRRDVRYRLIAQEGEKVNPEPQALVRDVFWVALTHCERLVFAEELVGSGLEALATAQFARAVLQVKVEIPLLSEGLCALQAVGLGRGPMIASSEV